MALVDQQSFYVVAYFEETKLPGIRVGMRAQVRLMSGDQPIDGTVESISSGITDRNSTPDGQLLANVEPTFNWVRLAQRIPVRIRLDQVPADVHLSAGMTASVTAQGTERQRLRGAIQRAGAKRAGQRRQHQGEADPGVAATQCRHHQAAQRRAEAHAQVRPRCSGRRRRNRWPDHCAGKLCTTGGIIQLIALQTISTGGNPMLPRLSGTAASARAKAAGSPDAGRRWPRRSASQPPI